MLFSSHFIWRLFSGTITITLSFLLIVQGQSLLNIAWSIRQVVFYLYLSHFWQRFLAQFEENFFQGYYGKIISSFSKTILIEQAELDRLYQRQLHDYSPELKEMARLQNSIRNIMARKNLSVEERLNLILALHIRFDKLKRMTSFKLRTAIPGWSRATAVGTSRVA